MKRIICNICGKKFKAFDEQGELGLHTRLGYGSVHDGDKLNLDICLHCLDNVIIHLCKISPIEEE